MIAETVEVPLEQAYGNILAQDIISEASVPSFPRSAMDGYAVFSKDIESASNDTPVTLKVAGEIFAGDDAGIEYAPGSAVRIMTGGMIPEGYDAVVRQEDTDYGEKEVRVFVSLPPYRNYCHIGEEIKKGQTVIKAGTMIGRTEIGLMASLGMLNVRVRRPARVAVISTGNELTEVGQSLSNGRIYNSIRYILGTSIRREKLEVGYEATCIDDKDTIRSSICRAVKEYDIVLTTGGVSVGEKDLVPGVLDDLGAVRLFSGVNIQPGTPTMASVLEGRVILSLSGNPYAAMANFDLYFWPVIARLMGSDAYLPGESEAVLADRYDKVNRMRRLVRARESDGRVYLVASEHMSSVFGNTAECNCYIDIPAGCRIAPGDRVRIKRMRL